MANEVSLWIRAYDKTKEAFGSVKSGLSGLTSGVKGWIGGIVGATALLATFKKSLSEAFKIEAQETPFERFVGGAKEAKEHIKALQDIGASGVVKTDDLLAASQALFKVSNGAIGAAADMRRFADAAAITGTPVTEIGRASCRERV